MKKIIIAAALLISSSTFANMYIGATVGKEANSYKYWYQGKNLFMSKDAYAARAKLGYEFNPNLAIETGLLGTTNLVKHTKVNAKDIIVDAFGKVTMTSNALSVSTKVGGARIISTNHNALKNAYTWGVGANADYAITDNVALDLETIHYFKAENFHGLNYLGVGCIYKF